MSIVPKIASCLDRDRPLTWDFLAGGEAVRSQRFAMRACRTNPG